MWKPLLSPELVKSDNFYLLSYSKTTECSRQTEHCLSVSVAGERDQLARLLHVVTENEGVRRCLHRDVPQSHLESARTNLVLTPNVILTRRCFSFITDPPMMVPSCSDHQSFNDLFTP